MTLASRRASGRTNSGVRMTLLVGPLGRIWKMSMLSGNTSKPMLTGMKPNTQVWRTSSGR